MNATQKIYSQVFANFYALMLKTQNYHWHVRGPHFKPLHLFFEEQYQALSGLVDTIAERMIALGFSVPANFTFLNDLKSIPDGDHSLSANKMVIDLSQDYVHLIDLVYQLIDKAREEEDEASLSMFSDILVVLEKTLWMLRATGDVS